MAKIIYDDEFINLNITAINKVKPQDVKRLLADRTSNLEDKSFSMDYNDIIKITAIDHFVCRKIVNGESVTSGSRFVAYLEELYYQLLRQPLLIFMLPIRNVDINILEKYVPNINVIVEACNKKMREAKEIDNKLKNGMLVSGDEINTLVKFFYYSCNNDFGNRFLESQDRLVRYLLTKARHLGLYSSSFIIKYFGYKKCREVGLDGIQIFVGDLSGDIATALGAYHLKTITISKKDLIGTSFKDNTLKSEYNRLPDDSLEGFVAIKTLYHEIRHACQEEECLKNKTTDLSYMMSIMKILSDNDSKEYNRNYKNYDIEADANHHGWLWLRALLMNYMKMSENDRRVLYAEIYRHEHQIKKSFASKVDKMGKRRFVGLFEKENLDDYFKREPESLRGEFSHFRLVYNDNGMPKGLNELIRFKAYSTVKFPNFYLNQVSARMVSGEAYDYSLFDKLSIDEKKDILINFNSLICTIYGKFLTLKQQFTNGKFLLDNMKSEEYEVIKSNVKKYFILAKLYVKELSIFINRYPELMNYGVDYYFSKSMDINYMINDINENKIVQRFVDGEQIGLVSIPTKDDVSIRRGK